MNILDSLPKDEFGRLCSDVIKRGEVYLICLDRSNGIIPPDGNETRNKFFVVLGYDADMYMAELL